MELQQLKSFSFLILTLWIATLVTTTESFRSGGHVSRRGGGSIGSFKYVATNCRAHTASLADFGGVGDGVTSNTRAFADAVNHLSQFGGDGGGMLYVPTGRWLTGPFNLTSYFTLFLDADAVILASQDLSEWPVIDPLPSYGHGRDKAGGRYSNLIGGSNLTDVIITGNNGTIDGQGEFWWKNFHSNKLKYTRGYLVELMYSNDITISNLTFVNSMAWNIHPVYSSNIVISGITILAPIKSPNTDGINPDSCSHVRIEDCYIVSGDDCVAIKSGWDEYGIAFGMPSEHIIIRRLTCISPYSAMIALGSEMSGGIQDVRAEDITAIDTESGVRIKTAVGRGAFVKDIFVRGMNLHTMKWVFWMTGNYKSHPDSKYDPQAIPGDALHNILYRSSIHGRGLNRFWSNVEGYLGPILILISATSIDAGQNNSNVKRWVIGILTEQGFENRETFYGNSGFLYAISPIFRILSPVGKEKNFLYSHLYPTGRVYEPNPKPVGLAFGGTMGNERIFIDEDFARVTVRHHAVDKTYQHGSLIPNQGFLPTEASVLEVEVWGFGGKSAKQQQDLFMKRETLFTEQRRKVDLKTFGNWEDSPEKAMMNMMGDPNRVRREDR